MLSPDELTNGRIFILRLWDTAGVPSHWVETLRGDTARHWYDIYCRSDWEALRMEAASVFQHRLTEQEAEQVRRHNRCVVIHTQVVSANAL